MAQKPLAPNFIKQNLSVGIRPRCARPAGNSEDYVPRVRILCWSYLDVDTCDEGTVCGQVILIKISQDSCRSHYITSRIINLAARTLCKLSIKHTASYYKTIWIGEAVADKATNCGSLEPWIEIELFNSEKCIETKRHGLIWH